MTDDASHPCSSCGAALEADARFCKKCGAAVAAEDVCDDCGAPLEAGARFCKKCGAATEPESDDSPEAAEESPASGERERSRPRPRAAGEGPVRPRGAGAGRKNPMLTIAIVVAVVAGLGVAIFAYMDNANKPAATDPMTDDGMGGHEGMTAANAGSPVFGGSIEVADAMKASAPGGGVFYVMARPAEGGPPLAVVKMPASSEPTAFTIGPADMMMGGTITTPVTLQVRWDQDGDAMSRQAGDLVGETKTPVSPGTLDVKLVISGKLSDDVVLGGPVDGPDSAPASAPDLDPAGDGVAEEPASAPASAPAEVGGGEASAEVGGGGAPTGGEIRGTLQFAPDIFPDAPERGLFFLIARPAGVVTGPPVAVVRLPGAKGPVPFTLGPKDAMMGGTLGDAVNLEVRWDQDGNAMTKQAGDIEGTFASNPAVVGKSDVIIVLDTVRTN